MVEQSSDLIARLMAKAEAERDPVDALLETLRTVSKQLDEAQGKKNGNGNGNGNGGNGWLGKLLTERVIALLIMGMLALVGWVGYMNIRMAKAEYGIQSNVEYRQDHEDRIRTLENGTRR